MSEQPTFKSFLLAEYSSLAQAHFNTIQTISSFFHYYVLILTAAIAAGGFLINFLKENSAHTFSILPLLIFFLFIFSLVGLCLLLYISNLRFDTILYARGVNGIRKYFYNVEGLLPAAEFHIRALPKNIFFPRFFEPRYFIPVILTFCLLDSLSLGLSLYCTKMFYGIHFFSSLDIILSISILFFFGLHIWLYYSLSKYRENEYIRSNRIGIDIDGVLNKHREFFCVFMRFLFKKRIDPKEIIEIPVHDCKNLNITIQQEREIFHTPAYWKKMPEFKGAAEVIERLRNSLGYKIHIISSRPWPNFKLLEMTERTKYRRLWSYQNIKNITAKWLRSKNIPFDYLTIEGDNSFAFSPDVNYNNRFWIAAKHRFKLFIEDDLQKAIKLTHICDVVFLIDQPYNQTSQLMPTNLIRVKEWKQIIHYIRANL